MAVASAVVTVGATATALHVGDPDAQSVEVSNSSSVIVYWGGPDVSAATGVPIVAGGFRTFDLFGGDVVYGVVASGTADVRVGRVGVG